MAPPPLLPLLEFRLRITREESASTGIGETTMPKLNWVGRQPILPWWNVDGEREEEQDTLDKELEQDEDEDEGGGEGEAEAEEEEDDDE